MFGTRAGRKGLSTRSNPLASGALVVVALGLLLAVSSVALADALVVVNVRGENGAPADGQVTLTAEAGGQTYSCQTQAGKCELPKVPGGSYKASVVPRGSNLATPPRAVMIPPAGKVSLIVSTVLQP